MGDLGEPYLCVYASQLAACIGRHSHCRVGDAVLSVWERASPAGFREAMARNGLRTEDELVEDLVSSRDDLRALFDRSLRHEACSAGVAASYADVSDELAAVDMDESDRRLLGAALRKNLFTGYGTRAEPEALEYVRGALGIPCREDPRLHRACMGEVDGVPWHVAGRVDAVSDSGAMVIEIKNRVNRLFGRVPQYEQLQVRAYLELLGAPHGVLVECLKGAAGGMQANALPVTRDREQWEREVVPRLRAFVHFVLRLVREPALQDAFLKSKRRSAMVKFD